MSALKTHFLNLYSMALADSSFTESELATFYQTADRHNISKAEVDQIILNPATVHFTVPGTIDEKIEYLYDYAKMIVSDGVIEDSEVAAFEKFCRKFEFQEENIPQIRELMIDAAKNGVETTEILAFVNQTV